MRLSEPVELVGLLMALVLSTEGQVLTTTQLNLDETVDGDSLSECNFNETVTGLCVPRWNCDNDHNLVRTGVITDDALRFSSECPINQWCCLDAKVIKVPSTTAAPVTVAVTTAAPVTVAVTTAAPTEPSHNHNIQKQVSKGRLKKCFANVDREAACPWCVLLYRGGNDLFRSSSGLFCMGALIGANVILTSATCVTHARSLRVRIWAQVPDSADPSFQYTVDPQTLFRHPKYNSGTRKNDIALMRIRDDIVWKSRFGVRRAACFDPETLSADDCLAANIDDNDNIVMSSVYVSPGSCFAAANESDAMCATGLMLDTLLHGAPIICSKDNRFILTGLTKMSYGAAASSNALVGNLDYAWLVKNLKNKMELNDTDFLFNLNYNSAVL